jgi:hypothetical protein
MARWQAGDKLTTALLEEGVPNIVARGRRSTAGSTTTSSVGLLRLDDKPVKGGLCYTITGTVQASSTIAGDLVQARITYTTDGSTPTTASPTLDGSSAVTRIRGNGEQSTLVFDTEYEPAGDETLSLLLVLTRAVGTGTVSAGADAASQTKMRLLMVGEAVGDTGVDV